MLDHGKSLSKIQKTDAAIKEYVERAAIWMDDGGQMLDPGNMMAGSNSKLSGAVR